MSSSMYYMAIVAPSEIDSKIKKWKEYMREHFGCSVALRSPAHITLIPPFWHDNSDEENMKKLLGEFCNGKKEFQIAVDGFGSFPPRVLFVNVQPSTSLETLKGQLEDYLIANSNLPVKKETRSFHPHITIANRDLMKRDYLPAWEHFRNIKYAAEFPAKDISLLKHNSTNWEIIYTAHLI
jgi:2'-5' RNA ligase